MDKGLLNNKYLPTLRLVITDECLGNCPFCHNEGQCFKRSANYMAIDLIDKQIVPAVKKIGIKKIIVTGGEPTLHPDLLNILQILKTSCPHTQIGITSNGYNIEAIEAASQYLDKLTISISSFLPDVYMRYTAVNPMQLMEKIARMKMKTKAVSIVITEDNYCELEDMITRLASQHFEVKLQFVIGNSAFNSSQKYCILRRLSRQFGECSIRLEVTPTIVWEAYGSLIRLKMDSLNSFVYDNIFIRKICMDCLHKSMCIERGCAIRVYPNGEVSLCLDKYRAYDFVNLENNLVNAYHDFEVICN